MTFFFRQIAFTIHYSNGQRRHAASISQQHPADWKFPDRTFLRLIILSRNISVAEILRVLSMLVPQRTDCDVRWNFRWAAFDINHERSSLLRKYFCFYCLPFLRKVIPDKILWKIFKWTHIYIKYILTSKNIALNNITAVVHVELGTFKTPIQEYFFIREAVKFDD